MGERKSTLILITILQIIACIGVLNGHFLLNFCYDFCIALRASILKNTLFSYFFMGDLNVQLFFVLGGFLIPISSAGKNEFTYKRVISKWTTLIIPAIILTLITFVTYLLVYSVLKNSITIDTPTSLLQLIDDISIFLIGKPILLAKELSNTPYILSQLWFIFPFFKGWLVSYCAYHMCKNKGIVSLILVISIISLLDTNYTHILIGVLFGEISLHYRYNNKFLLYFFILVLLSISPIIFSSTLYNQLYIKLILYIIFGFIFWFSSCLEVKIFGEKIITSLGKYTMGIYYVHQPILFLLIIIYRNIVSVNTLIFMYILVILITLFCAILSKNYIFDPIKSKIDTILNLLK